MGENDNHHGRVGILTPASAAEERIVHCTPPEIEGGRWGKLALGGCHRCGCPLGKIVESFEHLDFPQERRLKLNHKNL